MSRHSLQSAAEDKTKNRELRLPPPTHTRELFNQRKQTETEALHHRPRHHEGNVITAHSHDLDAAIWTLTGIIIWTGWRAAPLQDGTGSYRCKNILLTPLKHILIRIIFVWLPLISNYALIEGSGVCRSGWTHFSADSLYFSSC